MTPVVERRLRLPPAFVASLRCVRLLQWSRDGNPPWHPALLSFQGASVNIFLALVLSWLPHSSMSSVASSASPASCVVIAAAADDFIRPKSLIALHFGGFSVLPTANPWSCLGHWRSGFTSRACVLWCCHSRLRSLGAGAVVDIVQCRVCNGWLAVLTFAHFMTFYKPHHRYHEIQRLDFSGGTSAYSARSRLIRLRGQRAAIRRWLIDAVQICWRVAVEICQHLRCSVGRQFGSPMRRAFGFVIGQGIFAVAAARFSVLFRRKLLRSAAAQHFLASLTAFRPATCNSLLFGSRNQRWRFWRCAEVRNGRIMPRASVFAGCCCPGGFTIVLRAIGRSEQPACTHASILSSIGSPGGS